MSSASDKVNFMEQFMGRQRERGWKDSSYLRYCEEAFVKRMIDNKGKNVSCTQIDNWCSSLTLSAV